MQLIGFIIIAPYISQARWSAVFEDEQTKPLSPIWFTAFQVVSSYTNTGMSLVDQSMLPFQDAKVMILVMIVLVLAGNTSFVRVAVIVMFKLLTLLLSQSCKFQ